MRRPKEHAEIGERVLSLLRKRGINMENKRLIELVNVSKDYDGDVAVAVLNALYEYGSRTVTISYNTDYKIIGFYVK